MGAVRRGPGIPSSVQVNRKGSEIAIAHEAFRSGETGKAAYVFIREENDLPGQSVLVQSTGSGTRVPGFEPQLCHLKAG